MMMDTSSNSSFVLSDNPNTSVAVSTVNQSSRLPQVLPSGEPSGASHKSVAILWDIENCPIPSDVRPEDVAGNIRMTLRVHPVIKGAVTLFSAYGDFNAFPRRLREGCQRTGVKLIDVPNGRKDAADKAILVDMFLFALDNPPPSSIMLISGDVDFAPALHILGQRGYTVILVIPAGVGVSSALCNAGRYVWDWPSVARGEGFLPPRSVMSSGPNFATYMPGGHLGGCGQEPQNEEESIVYEGTSQTEYSSRSNMNQVYCFNSTQISRGEFSGLSHSLSEYSNRVISSPCFPNPKRQNFPSGVYNADEGDRKSNRLWWVQPGDIQGLKAQLVKLLELCHGSIPLLRLPPEYHKMFGRQLYVLEYGESKLVNLLSKMDDVLTVEGKGHLRCVCLCNYASQHKKMGVSMVKKDKRERNSQEEKSKCIDIICEVNASSDDEKIKESHNRKAESSESPSSETEETLDAFRFELQELLVSHNCKILFCNFEALYELRYKRTLDLRSFDVDDLEELLEKVRDVVVLHEDEEGRRKFVTAR